MTDQPFDPDRPVDPSRLKTEVVHEDSGEPFTGSLFVLTCDARLVSGRMDPLVSIETELDSVTVAGLIPGFLRRIADLFEAQQKAGELDERFAEHDAHLATPDDDEQEETP